MNETAEIRISGDIISSEYRYHLHVRYNIWHILKNISM